MCVVIMVIALGTWLCRHLGVRAHTQMCIQAHICIHISMFIFSYICIFMFLWEHTKFSAYDFVVVGGSPPFIPYFHKAFWGMWVCAKWKELVYDFMIVMANWCVAGWRGVSGSLFHGWCKRDQRNCVEIGGEGDVSRVAHGREFGEYRFWSNWIPNNQLHILMTMMMMMSLYPFYVVSKFAPFFLFSFLVFFF